MAEYIEKEAAIKELMSDAAGQVGYSREDATDCIRYMDAADVAPVVHALWDGVDWVKMESGGHELIRTPNAALRCSNCCNCFKKELLWKDNYCPNCGARCDK